MNKALIIISLALVSLTTIAHSYQKGGATASQVINSSSFEEGGIYYNVNADCKTVEVARPQSGSDYHGNIVIPETVEHEGSSYTVTSIESGAFFRCTELTSIKIPQTIKTIGENAFYHCESLKTVDISNLSNWCAIDFQGGDSWFSNPISQFGLEHLLVNGEDVTDMVIPDDVVEISRNAFYLCAPLRSLEIPGTVKTIGEDAFHRCYNLRKVILHEGIEHVRKGGLANMKAPTITIPKSMKQLEQNALNYENTESWLRNVCLLSPNPDAIALVGDLGLESTVISVPAGTLEAYKNHSYWGQFTLVEGLDEDDFSNGVVRVDFFYVEEPMIMKDANGYFAPTIHGYPGYQYDGTLTCDFALGLYQDGQLKYITWRFWNDWTFTDWKTCSFTHRSAMYLHDVADESNYNIADGNYQLRMLYKTEDSEWIPMVNSDNIFIDITVNGNEMTLRNRFLNGAKLHLESFTLNGMPKMGHDITASASVTNEGLNRKGCLYLQVNDTVKSFVRPFIKPQQTMDVDFEDFVFQPQAPGTYRFKVVNGEGEVLKQQEMEIPEPEKNHLELANLQVDNLYGEFVVSKENLSLSVEVKNDGDAPYNDELKFVTRMIWGFYEDGDTLISYNGAVYRPLIVEKGESTSCHYDYIDYDYFEKIGKRPNPAYNAQHAVEIYYYSEGKEVLLAKTPYYLWINPEEYEGMILVKPTGFSREYGDENPEMTYSVYGGALNGEPNIYTGATVNSPAGHYEIMCEQGSVTNDNVVFGNGVMAVKKAPLTVTALSCSREQGQENPSFELSYTGFKNEENEDVLEEKPVAITTATQMSESGMYPITVSGGKAQNYVFQYVDGILTITEPSIVKRIVKNDSSLVVYNLEGQKVLSKTASLQGLPHGIYVVGGKKLIVR